MKLQIIIDDQFLTALDVYCTSKGYTRSEFVRQAIREKLFPVSNSRFYRNKFCPSGIVAINFCSSCHLDKSDDQKEFAGDMIQRLRLVVNQFEHIRLNH